MITIPPADPMNSTRVEPRTTRSLSGAEETSDRPLTPTPLAYDCPRCAADPQPPNFGSRRTCAFREDGSFTPENWNCATICELFAVAGDAVIESRDGDESLQAFATRDGYSEDGIGGFIVLTRYKQRGCTSSAVHVGDFWPPRRATLELVDRVIAEYAK